MRPPPVFQKLDVPFGSENFGAQATIAFAYDDGDVAGPAQQITVLAGRQGTWTIVFAPQAPIPQGAQIALRKIENEFRFAYRHQHYWPEASNYVTVEDGEGNPLPFECDTCLKSAVWAIVTLPHDLGPGQAIVVRLGDQRQGGKGSTVWSTTYQQARVAAGVRLPGERLFRPCPEATVSVAVIPCPPVKRFHLHAPSTVPAGEPFAAIALAVDINGNPIPASQQIEVTVPEGVHLGAEQTPSQTLRVKAMIETPGIARLELVDHENGVSAHSNPIRVCADSSAHNVYWGEFHWHGYDAVELNVLNPDTDPGKAFRYARDASRLDFCASGSHIFRHSPDAVHEWWDLYREAALQTDEPGVYVPFLGCEWRDTEREGGDRNIVWRDLEIPAPDPTWRIADLYRRFRDHPVMVIPHVGGTIAMPYKHDPDVERLCEMVSGHGQFEWFAQVYLSKGYKLGLVGGSDGHRGMPGHPRVAGLSGGRFANLRLRDVGWSGGPLLAVLAERLDRESLWEAFRTRRTYASTGARALLSFRANGAPMGAEIEAERNVTIEWQVEGTAPVERVELIRDQFGLMKWDGCGTSLAGSLVDRPPDGDHYYYLRVEQQDGELLWSSPIWIDSRCGGSNAGLLPWDAPEPVALQHIGDTPARAHLDDLLAYLRTEEQISAFGDITPYKVVDSPMGRYAVFLCTFGERRLQIHWFYEFETPRIRLEVGWRSYGRERIMGQHWSRPRFEGQDGMG